MAAEADRHLRQFERDAVVACGAMAAVALVVSRGVEAPLGVLAGGLLMALSYLAVKGGVDAVVGRGSDAPGAAAEVDATPAADPAAAGSAEATGEPAEGPPPVRLSLRRRVLGAVKFFTRYALLALGAYVMLSCFRLHPMGLMAGAVSPFVAALAQVVRMSRASD